MTTLVLFFFRDNDKDVHNLLLYSNFSKENTLIGLGSSFLLAVVRAFELLIWSYRRQYRLLFHVQWFPFAGQLSPEKHFVFHRSVGFGWHMHCLTKWWTILTTSEMLSLLMAVSGLGPLTLWGWRWTMSLKPILYSNAICYVSERLQSCCWFPLDKLWHDFGECTRRTAMYHASKHPWRTPY